MTRTWPFGKQCHSRLLLRESVLEFYLDDILIQSFSLPAVATGRLALLGEGIQQESLRAWYGS